MTTSSRILKPTASSRPAATSRRQLLATAAALAAILTVGTARAAAATADAFIQEIGNATVAILKETDAPVTERVAKLKAILNQATDLPYVGRVILGRHWRAASEKQRQEYLRLFDALVLEAMAERIGSYTGQIFEVASTRKVDDQDSVVSTLISQPDSPTKYRLDWRVRKGDDGRFQVIDIVAEGVSLVLTQRSEVNSIVSSNGIDGLLAEMQRRLERRDVTRNLPPA
jgi:phospholipid transport system substrate-binding protein